MPPTIHPVDLIHVLRQKRLTPAIIFLTSRRACDEAIDHFHDRPLPLTPQRSTAIAKVFETLTTQYPSIADHPLITTVQQYGVAAHHAGHLPSWKIAIEELMRTGCLDAVFATTTLASGVDFPARTVVISQSSVRKARDFMELTVGEIQQLAGRGGRRGKDLVGFVVLTPSPYMDLQVLTKGLTGHPEPIDSQFVISFPMVLNLLKAHTVEHIQPILGKSFAQYQLNQRADILERKFTTIQVQLDHFGHRQCNDWISQWQLFDLSKRQRPSRQLSTGKESPELAARIPFLTAGRVVGLHKKRAVVLRPYHSRGQRIPMITVIKSPGNIMECPASNVTHVFDHLIEFTEIQRFPWSTPKSLDSLINNLKELPSRLRILPIRVEPQPQDTLPINQTGQDHFPCPSCPSRPACRTDHAQGLRLRQEHQRLTQTIRTLRSELWHHFQEHVKILQKFGYLTATSQLTPAGDWARLIRINHSLLITELIRMEAFTGIEPGLLTGVLASIAHDNDRPGIFPRCPPELWTVMNQVRSAAESLSLYEEPPLLRSDIAALANQWVSHPSLTWVQFIRTTSMAEGDVYRLLARTIEYLSQLFTLKKTHPDLATIANRAIIHIRRDVLQELP